MVVKDKVNNKASQIFESVKRVVINGEQAVQAISLLIVGAYNYYDLTIRPVGKVEYAVRVAATCVIAARGAVELVKFLDKKR